VNALQLDGHPTARQSVWAVLGQMYCACAQTANCELPIKILTSPSDSATQIPDFQKGKNNSATTPSLCDLDRWQLTLNVCRTSAVTWSKSVTNLSKMEQSAAELLMTSEILAVVMSSFDLDLWPLDLFTLNVCSASRHMFKLYTKFERDGTISGWVIDNLATFCPITSRCDLGLSPLDLERLIVVHDHVVILYTKFEQNRTLCGWVIDHLVNFWTFSPLPSKNQEGWVKCWSGGFLLSLAADLWYVFSAGPLRGLGDSTHFHAQIFRRGGGENKPLFLRDGESNYTKFWDDIHPSLMLL